MDILWKYKIDVTDRHIFEELEKERNIVLPDDLKVFIMESNAATPSKYRFMVGTIERVLGAVLSFNKGEEDADTVFTALSVIEDKNILPFAIDPFGNYICYLLKENEVAFWDHETGKVSLTGSDLKEFLEKLY